MIRIGSQQPPTLCSFLRRRNFRHCLFVVFSYIHLTTKQGFCQEDFGKKLFFLSFHKEKRQKQDIFGRYDKDKLFDISKKM